MIEVNGKGGVKVKGYRIVIQAEFTVLCHDLMFKMGFDQDDLLFAISLASIPDDALLRDRDKTNEQLKEAIKKNPELGEVLDALMKEAGHNEGL